MAGLILMQYNRTWLFNSVVLLAVPSVLVAIVLRVFGTMVAIERLNGTSAMHTRAFYSTVLWIGGGAFRESVTEVWPMTDSISSLCVYVSVELFFMVLLFGMVAIALSPVIPSLFGAGFQVGLYERANVAKARRLWSRVRVNLLPGFALCGLFYAGLLWFGFRIVLEPSFGLAASLGIAVALSLTSGPLLCGAALRLYSRPFGTNSRSNCCRCCGYEFGARGFAVCPECGQPWRGLLRKNKPFISPWFIRQLSRKYALAMIIALSVVLAVPYAFEDFKQFRPHLILLSDWNRKFGENYASQLHRGFEGKPEERMLLTGENQWLHCMFSDGPLRRQLSARVFHVVDPASRAMPLANEGGISELLVVTVSRVVSGTGEPVGVADIKLGVHHVLDDSPHGLRAVWRSNRVVLWNRGLREGGLGLGPRVWPAIRNWYIANSADLRVVDLDAHAQAALEAKIQPMLAAALALEFGPEARLVSP